MEIAWQSMIDSLLQNLLIYFFKICIRQILNTVIIGLGQTIIGAIHITMTGDQSW